MRDEWILRAVEAPLREVRQRDGRLERGMRVRYFEQTDTLLIELRDVPVAETRDLDENAVIDVVADGAVCAITVEHASRRAGFPEFSFERVAA